MNALRPAGLLERVERAARRIERLLDSLQGASSVPQPDWLEVAAGSGALRRPIAWRNRVVRTPGFARLHVEWFAIPGEIGVLHVCGFPRLDRALPIFGFDIVTGREKATGCFLDLSPTVPGAEPRIDAWAEAAHSVAPRLGERRTLPDWASMFSRHALAVRPRDAAEVEAGLALGEASLAALLADTEQGSARQDRADPVAMREAQFRYIDGQRRNDRTRRMLAGCIGPELADRFIDEVLFPLPEPMACATASVP